jgi:hypothetical protein
VQIARKRWKSAIKKIVEKDNVAYKTADWPILDVSDHRRAAPMVRYWCDHGLSPIDAARSQEQVDG